MGLLFCYFEAKLTPATFEMNMEWDGRFLKQKIILLLLGSFDESIYDQE